MRKNLATGLLVSPSGAFLAWPFFPLVALFRKPTDPAENPRSNLQVTFHNLASGDGSRGCAGQGPKAAEGNFIAVVDALGKRTEYTYDENNNRISQKDANNHVTTMEYDALNRMVRKVYPNMDEERWSYDANGNAIAHVKGTDSTAYQIDAMNREVFRKYFPSGHEVRTTYTADGRKDSVIDHRGLTRFVYDNRGQLAAELLPNGDFIENDFDAQGNRIRLATPFDTTRYTFDALNRMDSVLSSSGITVYRYNAVGNRDSVQNSNGTAVGYSYDNLSRLTEVRNWRGSSLLSRFTYTLNDAGIRTAVDELDASHVAYGYDDLYRLTSETRTGSSPYSITYTYDTVGNRLTQVRGGVTTTYTYNSRDQLTGETSSAGSVSYTYDAAGRQTSKATTAGTIAYAWIDKDRLDSISGPGVAIKYAYDAEGRRVKETVGSQVKQFLIDRLLPFGQVILETDGSGNLNASFTYGAERISQLRSGAIHFYLADGQGSIRQLTDTAGILSDTWTYTAFGELLARTGTTENNFLYTGEQFDPNSGFYYNRARWMDPATGRFLSVDPFNGDPQAPTSLHRYLYANTSPISFSDPSGEITLIELVAAASSRVTLAVTFVGVAAARGASAMGAAMAKLGTAVENEVEALLSFALRNAATIQRGIVLVGEGGKRKLDFMIEAANRVAILEIKYKLPSKAGAALQRLVGQIQTANTAQEAIDKGARVVLFTFKMPSDAEMRLVMNALGEHAGRLQQVSGFTGLVQWARLFFHVETLP